MYAPFKFKNNFGIFFILKIEFSLATIITRKIHTKYYFNFDF